MIVVFLACPRGLFGRGIPFWLHSGPGRQLPGLSALVGTRSEARKARGAYRAADVLLQGWAELLLPSGVWRLRGRSEAAVHRGRFDRRKSVFKRFWHGYSSAKMPSHADAVPCRRFFFAAAHPDAIRLALAFSAAAIMRWRDLDIGWAGVATARRSHAGRWSCKGEWPRKR